MNLKQLQKLGAFTSGKIIKRTVTVNIPITKPEAEWADPEIAEYTGEFDEEQIDIHIRKSTAADALEARNSDDRSRAFVVVYRCICNPDGTPLFESLDQAMQLEAWMAIPLFNAVMEVAGLAPKVSAPKTSSGAS